MSSLNADKGWLVIGFMLDDKQVRLYPGLRDTRENRRSPIVKELCDLIQMRQWEALAARFPRSKHLARYRQIFVADTTTFGAACERFLDYQKNANKVSTVDYYRNILKIHLLHSAIVDKPLKLIGASDVMAIVGVVAQRGHTAQAANVRRVISAVFNWARGERGTDGEYLVADNPVTRTRPVVVTRDEEDEIDPFTTDEVARILGNARDGWERRLVTIAFETGLRIAENFGLKRADIDLNERIVHVRQTWSRYGEGSVKNKRSRRAVALSDAAIRALREQLRESELRQWLWIGTGAKPRDPQRFSSKNWPAILKRAGVDHRPFIQCRHTFATRLMQRGEDMQYIASQMGHANLQMLINHYLKWRQNKAEQRKPREM